MGLAARPASAQFSYTVEVGGDFYASISRIPAGAERSVTATRALAQHAGAGITLTNTLSGPVEILSWTVDGQFPSATECVLETPLQLVCQLAPASFHLVRLLVRATGPAHHHLANGVTQRLTVLEPGVAHRGATTVVGGQPVLMRATLTDARYRGARVFGSRAATRRGDRARPSTSPVAGLLDGLSRDFYVTTHAGDRADDSSNQRRRSGSSPTVRLTILPAGGNGGGARAAPVAGDMDRRR